jgi:hypothetical protein
LVMSIGSSVTKEVLKSISEDFLETCCCNKFSCILSCGDQQDCLEGFHYERVYTKHLSRVSTNWKS